MAFILRVWLQTLGFVFLFKALCFLPMWQLLTVPLSQLSRSRVGNLPEFAESLDPVEMGGGGRRGRALAEFSSRGHLPCHDWVMGRNGDSIQILEPACHGLELGHSGPPLKKRLQPLV